MADHATPQFSELMKFEATRAREFYVKAQPLLGLISSDSRGTLAVMIGIYGGVKYQPVAYNITDTTHPDAPVFTDQYFDVTNKVFAEPEMVELPAEWGAPHIPASAPARFARRASPARSPSRACSRSPQPSRPRPSRWRSRVRRAKARRAC